MSTTKSNGGTALAWWRTLFAWWPHLARQHPFVAFFLVIIWPNAIWSVANLLYNGQLIVERFCPEPERKAIFWDFAVPFYSTLTWVLGLAFCIWLIHPVRVFFQALEGRREMTADIKKAAQLRLVNLPAHQLVCNFFLWLPGGIFFPIIICTLGGPGKEIEILVQFLASFLVSAVVTSFQAYVLLEGFLLEYVFPRVFTDISPVQVEGGIRLSFGVRLGLVWGAVSLGPIIVLFLITVNLLFPADPPVQVPLVLAVGVVVFGVFTGGTIFWAVGQDLARWLETHMAATREISRENFAVRIGEQRADEWGRLTDSFNKMARDLSRGRHVYETLGHFVGPEVRDEILQEDSRLAGKVQEITVMFADIRGFTPRAAGKNPEEVVELLSRFLSLAVQAVEGKGGWVNKFLGDGFMALFGAPRPRSGHADLAVAAARDLLQRLQGLNQDLERHGQAPLKIGIGIHTGPAVVGRIIAIVPLADGREEIRVEYTAIGETVNLTQRLEELTKICAATLLLSEATRLQLQDPPKLDCVGPQEIRGSNPVVVYTIAGI
jgi:adenylate cyclase